MKQFIYDKRLFIRRLFLIILDAILINIASFSALLIRFDFRLGQIPTEYAEAVLSYVIINTVTSIVIFFLFRLYNSLWKYAGIDELVNIIFACMIAGALQLIGMHFIFTIHVPRSYYPLSTLFMMALISISRFFYRYARRLSKRHHGSSQSRIMIIGAGEAGCSIIREISVSGYVKGTIICAIDDNKDKLGSYIQGVKVVGGRDKIIEAAERYDITDIFIAMPSASRKDIKKILEICKETGCVLKILPGMYQIINEEVSVTRLRDVEIEDLLGREPVNIDMEAYYELCQG